MRDAWFAGAGIVFGWLMSKAWSDPGCQVGMVIFLVTTAVLTLASALAVVGHGRGPRAPAAMKMTRETNSLQSAPWTG
jgi:hypothetical protein